MVVKELASRTATAIAMVMRIALIGSTLEGPTFVWDPVRESEGVHQCGYVRAVVIDARIEIPSVNGFGRS